MKKIFLLFSILITATVFAQDTLGKHSRIKIVYTPSKKDTLSPAGRNEISTNIAPVFAAVIGGFPDNEACFSVFYKRAMKNPRVYIREGFLFKPEIPNYFFSTDTRDLYYNVTDSTRIFSDFNESPIHRFQVNSGIEWRSKSKRRWRGFFGADVIGGYFRGNIALTDTYQKLDSTGEWNIDFSSARPFELRDYKRTNNWYAGVHPFCGIQYAFNRHWALSLQSGVEAYFLSGNYVRRANTTSLAVSKASYFEFNMPALADEFSIVYRF